jgi:hypothetical protein
MPVHGFSLLYEAPLFLVENQQQAKVLVADE